MISNNKSKPSQSSGTNKHTTKTHSSNGASKGYISTPGGDLGEFILAMDTYLDDIRFFGNTADKTEQQDSTTQSAAAAVSFLQKAQQTNSAKPENKKGLNPEKLSALKTIVKSFFQKFLVKDAEANEKGS